LEKKRSFRKFPPPSKPRFLIVSSLLQFATTPDYQSSCTARRLPAKLKRPKPFVFDEHQALWNAVPYSIRGQNFELDPRQKATFFFTQQRWHPSLLEAVAHREVLVDAGASADEAVVEVVAAAVLEVTVVVSEVIAVVEVCSSSRDCEAGSCDANKVFSQVVGVVAVVPPAVVEAVVAVAAVSARVVLRAAARLWL
jgi:hypothetical protein